MQKSCGFIIRSQNKILICHPTGKPWGYHSWDLPKGRMESGESELETAFRETQEETGLDVRLYKGKIKKVGEFEYKTKNKTLCVFLFDCVEDITDIKLKCSTFFEEGKPENDMFMWVDKQEAERKLYSICSQAVKMI